MEVSGIIASFLVSRVADRTGHFRSVIAGLIFMSGVSLVLLNLPATFSIVFIGALALGFFLKPVIPLTDALTGRSLADASLNYGLVRVWGTVSFVLISLVLQFTGVLETGGSQRIFLAILIALFFQLISIRVAPPAPSHADILDQQGLTGTGKLPKGFISFLTVCFIGNIGASVYNAFGTLYFLDIVGVSRVSGLIALAAISEIPVMLLGGRIIRRIGHRRMLTVALSAGILRLAILALFPSVLPLALSQLTHAFTYGFFLLTGVDWVNRTIPTRQRALGMGLFMSVSFSGSLLVGSSLGGFLLEAAGFPILFSLAAIFPAVALIWLQIDKRFFTWDSLDDLN
jgi:PPP family 3-phenylpropionic acid transporter